MTISTCTTGYIVAMTDITERKCLEEKLRASEERLRLITDNIQDLVTQSDAEDRIVYASPSSRMVLGMKPEAIVGTLRRDFVHPDDWEKIIATCQAAIQVGREHLMIEGRLRHADGRYINIETMCKLFYDTQSHYTGAVYITRDITERKRLETLLLEREKLQTALEKEQELNALKTRMMERIAHEFRTPLAVIQLSSETLTHYYERLTPDKREAKVTTIKSQIQSITDMLDEIGLVVKGRFEPEYLNRVSTDVSALCRDATTKLAADFNLPDKFVLDLPETALAVVDKNILRSALLHMMRNAVQYSQPSEIVKASLLRFENSIELRVTDTGIGILPQELPRIFDPFFRGSNISELRGLGVGLTIAHAAIEAHNGTIKVESLPLQGTTVTICLPT